MFDVLSVRAFRLACFCGFLCSVSFLASNGWSQDEAVPARGDAHPDAHPDSHPDAHPDALAYAQAYGANMDSLRCFDLMMAGETHRLDADQPSVSRFFWRIIADYDRMTFLLLRETSDHVIATGSDQPTLKKSVFGFFVDEGSRQVWQIRSGDKPRRIDISRVAEEDFVFKLLRNSGFSDPRLIGLVPFPATFYDGDSMREIVRATFSSLSDSTFQRVDDDTVSISITKPFSEVSSVRYRYQFDVETLVPTNVKCEAGNRGDFRMVEQESISWKEEEGHLLPIEINGERSREQRPPSRDLIEEHYNVALRWQAINERDELPPLQAETLGDMERVMSLLADVHRFDDSRVNRQDQGDDGG